MNNLNTIIIVLLTYAFTGANIQTKDWPLKFGKYSCTASKFKNGSFDFIARGSVILTKDKKYSYLGFEKPSNGTYITDNSGNLLFKGGYLNGGQAERTDRTNKFLLTFPSNPDNRWTLTLIE